MDEGIEQESNEGVRTIRFTKVPVYSWAPVHGHRYSLTELQEGKAGITIRSHFAGLAMQTIFNRVPVDTKYEVVAQAAVYMADALIEQLNKDL